MSSPMMEWNREIRAMRRKGVARAAVAVSEFPALLVEHANQRVDVCPVGMCIIYALVDPRDGTVRYIGKTTRPGNRFDAHAGGESTYNRRLASWIRTLRRKGRTPDMHPIDLVHDSDWDAAERRWIAFYRARGRLFNIEAGGRSGRIRRRAA